ncbi:tripeptidyl-peptidase 2 isoform X1, partial [Clarias magur]
DNPGHVVGPIRPALTLDPWVRQERAALFASIGLGVPLRNEVTRSNGKPSAPAQMIFTRIRAVDPDSESQFISFFASDEISHAI